MINFRGLFIPQNFLMVDSYMMDKRLERSCRLVYYPVESQLSLVVTVWLSGVVIDWTFTLGGVDVSAHTYLLIIAT